MNIIEKLKQALPGNVTKEPAGAVIGEKEIAKAAEILQEYKAGKTNLESRIIDNEQWWKLRNNEYVEGKKETKASAWLFNSITAKHADAMDNIPTCNLLPREQGDSEAAQMLSTIVPVVFERNHYERTYSSVWDDKLKFGTGITGVFWDTSLSDGLGDINIKQIDILNVFWEPGVTDIQMSRNFFHCELMDNDLLEQKYPQMQGHTGQSMVDIAKYIYDDAVKTEDKSVVVDWYYKKMRGTVTVLHYVKFCNGVVLYASENDPNYAEKGWYSHGKYPFVFDPMFRAKGTPCGFGIIDVEKENQEQIDDLDTAIVTNAKLATQRRFFIRADGMINEKEYADFTKPFVHYSGSGNPKDAVMPIDMPVLPNVYVQILNNKVQELKETSGTNDFSRGSTTSGVTAASAIAALQEASSKTSRDMLKQTYSAYEEIVALVIELIREFYTTPRTFRIIGDNAAEKYVSFSNARIKPQMRFVGGGMQQAEYKPIFDINVKAQKQSPFSRISQNELAVQFYGMGVFSPNQADMALPMLEMMEFEGKDSIIEAVRKNAMVPQLIELLVQLAPIVESEHPEMGGLTQSVAPLLQQFGVNIPTVAAQTPKFETNPLGEAVESSKNNLTNKAADRAAEMASVM